MAPEIASDTHASQSKAYIPKVLVVDDNQDNRLLAGIMLEILGYEHENVTGGREALDHVTKTRYDVILMDIQMPDLDGLETTRRIRSFEKNSQLASTPIIAMTADVARIFEDECLEAGMNALILKPYTSNDLAQIIQPYLPS